MRYYDTDYPTPRINGYFRDGSANIYQFALEIAPALADSLGRTAMVADVGCSTGKATWCLASVLDYAGVDFRLDAYEYHEKLIKKARDPISIGPFFMKAISDEKKKANLPPDCDRAMSYDFEQCTADPATLLGDRVNFICRDILSYPLPNQQYDIASCHNVLYHYKDPLIHGRFLDNILIGIKPGGYLIHEDSFDDLSDPVYITMWRKAIEDRGLVEVDPSRPGWNLSVLQLPS